VVVHPPLSKAWQDETMSKTGIDPRHSLNHLSLLPPGPDEVRDRLLRGGRSVWFHNQVTPDGGNSAPHKADFGYRAPLAPRLAQPGFPL